MSEKTFLKRYAEWGYPQQKDFISRQAIRINTRLIKPSTLLQRFEEHKIQYEKIPFLEYGYYVKADFPLVSMIEYLLGYFYIQEAPAQLPGDLIKKECLKIKGSKKKILDLCAAPGGKTTHCSEAVRHKGIVVALDNSEQRSQKLCYNLERMQCENVIVFTKDVIEDNLQFLKEEFQEFDIVLLDAPCSGNFTQEKEWFQKRKLEDIRNRQRLQKKLFEQAYLMTKKKGLILYSTCSIEQEENEQVIESALQTFPDLTLEPISISEGSTGLTSKTKDAIRFWPTQHQQPGFFIAQLRKE